MKKYLMFAAVLCAGAAQAAVVSDCAEAYFDISTIITKSETTYSNGSIAAYEVDRIEPAASPAGIAINIHVRESAGGPWYVKCQAVSGLSSVDWAAKRSSYDENRGLLLTVPAHESDSDGNFRPVTLKIRINQENATVVLE